MTDEIELPPIPIELFFPFFSSLVLSYLYLMPTLPDILPKEEEQWLQGLRRGEEQALQKLFHHYYHYLVVTAYNILQDDQRAKDLVQDVFFHLWTKREELNIDRNLKAYLRRSVVNRSIDELRKRKRIHWQGEWNDDAAGASSAQAEEELAVEDLRTAIHQAIDGLPERCKIIFSLSRFEHFSNQQIAEQLEISIKTVENQMGSAIKQLKSDLAEFLMTLLMLSMMLK